jgi:hypothetical protein
MEDLRILITPIIPAPDNFDATRPTIKSISPDSDNEATIKP